MKTASWASSKKAASCFALFVLALLVALPCSAQSTDDVHIVPRVTRKTVAPSSVPQLVPTNVNGLYARPKPFRVNVDLVLVPVTVTDMMQRPVINLTKRNFALFENDKRQAIRYFSGEQGPISIAILLDVSKSMTDKIDTERAAVAAFFRDADPNDEYFAITFSNVPRLIASSTRSIDDIENKLAMIEPGGPTAMLDAVYLAESELRFARYQRKAILLITDGGDNVSRYTMHEVKGLVEESDVQIYAIGLFETFFFNTLEERMGKRWLSEITDCSGGRTLTVESRSKLPAAAAEISRELRSEYVLGYSPSAGKPNRWRNIRVKVAPSSSDRPLRADYKRGYLSAE